jgi:putative endonuclease
MNEKNWFTYIIATSDNQLYTGITTDMLKRWQKHAKGTGARYFRGRKPEQLCYLELFENRSLASKREAYIKSLPREQKYQLIHQSYSQTLGLTASIAIPVYELPVYELPV